jgi:broad specificity phosphatase PhoE
MATLYLVRHAQASLGAANDDQLSPLGLRQSVRLGQYFASRRLSFDAVVAGTLKRHVQTLAGISEGLDMPLLAASWPGLDEYDGQALIAALHPEPLADASATEHDRHDCQLLRQGLLQWMLGRTHPVGLPDWQEFRQGVVDVLQLIQASDTQNVLLISSGGPIACAVSHVLATPPESTVELNMRLRNTSVTGLSFTPKHLVLQTYNTLPHLDAAEFDSWITHV